MPDWRQEVRGRLSSLSLSPAREAEIVDELSQHLGDRHRELVEGGASPDEATRATLAEFRSDGALAQWMAPLRQSRVPGAVDAAAPHEHLVAELAHDLRYSIRTLRGSPAFSLTVLLAVALSIGPISAIVSVGNWLLWRPQPGVTGAHELATVLVGRWRQQGPAVSFSPSGVSYADVALLRTRARTFTGITGVEESSASLAVPGGLPRQAGTAIVMREFFDVLGVRLAAGRSFAPDEDQGPSGAPVVVISHALAQSAFGSARDALGKSIALNSRSFAVVGVAPPAFTGISTTGAIDAWLTGWTWPYLNHVNDVREDIFFQFVVRAAPGSTFDDVERELTSLTGQVASVAATDGDGLGGTAPRLFPGLGLSPLTRARTASIVDNMMIVGGVLVLLGCANIANLLILRTARRGREVAIRKALGASRSRLMRLQVMESWLLSVIGAALGLVLAVYLKQLIAQLLFPALPGTDVSVPIDARVLGLTVAIALATGTLAALVPGWLTTRTRGLAALGRPSVATTTTPKLRTSLAVLQVALSLTLLINALLLVSTLQNLRAVDLGFDPSRVSVATVSLDEHGYDSRRALAYHREVLAALEGAADFDAVSLSFRAPFGPGSLVAVIPPEGDQNTPVRVLANGVSDEYFRVLSIPIVRGRAFTRDETLLPGAAGPLIVNARLARQLFGTIEVVGRTLRLPQAQPRTPQTLTIVGVAGDAHWRSIAGEADPFMYQPFSHFRGAGTSGQYMIKSDLPSHRAAAIAADIAARIERAIPLSDPRPLASAIDRELNEERLFAWVLGLLAALGFTLAALGLYGLIAQAALERRREFGVRLALGATGWNIVRLVARHAVVVLSLGMTIGLVLTWFGTRVIHNMLFGVSPLDPSVYVLAIGTLTLVAALACAGPALRAFHVRAVEVLRAE